MISKKKLKQNIFLSILFDTETSSVKFISFEEVSLKNG